MAAEPSTKAKAWAVFDHIVKVSSPQGNYSNPWRTTDAGNPTFEPDFDVLTRLLGVPLHLNAATTTGVPALALDVWLSYEFRRAGFAPDAVWPRASEPRVLPSPIVNLLESLPKKESEALRKRLTSKLSIKGVSASSANILGKNYLKQVDVVMSDWATGPELLISTKRMDSSFGKNAANRVEESYGDAKNLRLRHPLAALGFVYGLRSTIFEEAPDTAAWLIDLLQKLGREDDAYHAVALLIIDYEDVAPPAAPDDEGDGENPLVEAGLIPAGPDEVDLELVPASTVGQVVPGLPSVSLLQHLVPDALQPGNFLASMTRRVLDATPVNVHRAARQRMLDPS